MHQKTYNWKRFWCSRTGNFSLADFGYLYVPDPEYAEQIGSDVVAFDRIASIPCLVMLGEPGMGKSTAARNAYEQVKASGEECLWVGLGDYKDDAVLCNAIIGNEAFQQWLKGDHKFHLFLDSLDEGLLGNESVGRILIRELDKLLCDRLCLRITCRTADWSQTLENKFLEKWGQDNVGVYELAPLQRKDVAEAAKKEAIDPDEFLKAIFDREAVPLAIKPITLKFLVNTYKREKRFPETQRDLYLDGCGTLCMEINPDRLGSGYGGGLSNNQRFCIAARIAAIFIFCNRSAIWLGVDLGDVPSSDVTIEELCVECERLDGQELQVTKEVIREVLSITGLFSSRGINRMGFAHQTYSEFLAAWYVAEHRKLPLTQILSLLVAPEDPERRLVPQLHETAAWMASWRDDVLQEIMKSDPDVILRSDIPIDANVRAAIIENLLSQYNEQKIRIFDSSRTATYKNYRKLTHPSLAEQLRNYILDTNKLFEARYKAIDIAEVCRVLSLVDNLIRLALDPSENVRLRVRAANAVCRIGDSASLSNLKPLIQNTEEELKGCGLQATWPDHVTTTELFKLISLPTKNVGQYRSFLGNDLVKHLQVDDIPFALNWLQQQEVIRNMNHPFASLSDALLLKAWENLECSGVIKPFAEIAIRQLGNYQALIDFSLDDKLRTLIYEEDGKRRYLIERLVHLSLLQQINPSKWCLGRHTEKVCYDKDILWMLEKIKQASSPEEVKIWTTLIRLNFNITDAKQTDSIINAAQVNQALTEEMRYFLGESILDSSEVKEKKNDYYERLDNQANHEKTLLLNPSPQERVISCLEAIEDGKLESWENLTRVMTLEPNSTHYGDVFNTDLTELPVWKVADTSLRSRIIIAAKKFVCEYKPYLPIYIQPILNTYAFYCYGIPVWIGAKTLARLADLYVNEVLKKCALRDSDFLGYKAIKLLLKESSTFANTTTTCLWKSWTPFILITYLDKSQRSQEDKDILSLVYQNARDMVITWLMFLIQLEAFSHNDFFVINKIEIIMDDYLAESLLNQAKDDSINLHCFAQIIEELVDYGHDESISFVRSLVSQYSNDNEKAVLAARVLLCHSGRGNWDILWQAFTDEVNFGRKIFESAAEYSQGNILNLNDKQLADFYVWLVRQYPHSEYRNSRIAGFRDSVLTKLVEAGTTLACIEIQRIIRELPHLNWLKLTLLDAQNALRKKNWNPVIPSEFFQLVSSSNMRLVQDGEQLLTVLIEELEGLGRKFQDQRPAAIDLWNEIEWGQIKRLFSGLSAKIKSLFSLDISFDFGTLKNINWKKLKGSTYLPKDEERLSDYVERYLQNALKSRGIILNREVEIRRGEITDIQVDAVLKTPVGEIYDTLTVIIEVKGCWNNGLNTAMETQLVNRYLKDNTCQHGLYLIGWFNCDQWDGSDSRKQKAMRLGSISEVRESLDRQAESLSQARVTIKAFVLNASLR